VRPTDASNAPTANGFKDMCGGALHAAALGSDGQIVAWGVDTGGPGDYGQVTDTPAGLFKAIGCGSYTTMALRDDGTIAVWGWDNQGVVSNAPLDGGYKVVAAGVQHGAALRDNGSIAVWGNTFPAPAGNHFVALWAGGYHVIAMRGDGSLVSWGWNAHGEVSNTPQEAGFMTASAGGYHSLAIHPLNEDVTAAIQALKAQVADLISLGAVLPANGQSLYAKLNAALGKVAMGDIEGAIDSLRAFVNQVKSFVKTGALTDADGQALIDAATDIIESLGG
jgi:alpha-tubulin suppressor-like RCC1 family protein